MKQILHNFIAIIRRYKVSSTLNVLGLAVAFASLYIIASQVVTEFSYNSSLKDSERVYNLQFIGLMGDDNVALTISSRPFIDMIVEQEPSVESYGSLTVDNSYYSIDGESQQDLLIESKNLNVSESAIDIFAPEIVEGSIDEFKNNINDRVIVSESYADAHSLSIGDGVVYFADNKQFKIAAIFRDIAEGSDFSGVCVIRNIGDENKNIPGNFNYTQYIKFKEGASPDDEFVRRGYDRINAKFGLNPEDNEKIPMRLMPIEEIYFAKDLNQMGFVDRGNIDTTVTMIAIAIVLLLIAIINFLNFFFALVPIRIKAVNTYKIYGASRFGLISTFIVESLGLMFISLFVAAVVVYALGKSPFAELVNSSIAFGDNLSLLFAIVGFAIVVAVLVTIYPSIYITSFPAAMALKSGFSSSRAGKIMRYVLIAVQFVATMILFVYMIFANMQYNYVMNYDMGFNKTDLLTTKIAMSIAGDTGLRDNFSDKLKADPDILDVAYISEEGMVSSVRMQWSRSYKDKELVLPIVVTSPNFLEFMGIDLVSGRNFYPNEETEGNGVFILNVAAAEQYGIEVGATIMGTDKQAEVVGICKNITHQHLKYSSSPMAFFLFGDNRWSSPSRAYIRISPNADVREVIDHIQKCSDEFSGDYTTPMEFQYFDEELGKTYDIEHKTTTLVTFFAFVSIMISLMGVFGLVLFETQFRQREIVLRRVHGATVTEILLMINRKFLIIIAICFLVAAPISYTLIDKWLSTFAYRIDISAWVFIVVLVVVTIITSLIVTIQSYRAASENPAKLIGKNS